MTVSGEKTIWGQMEKVGKGTKASYDPDKHIITFCFNRSPQISSEFLTTSRMNLLRELKELGYIGRIKPNGEVFVDNVLEQDVALVKKNHKLLIHLNKKQDGTQENAQL